MLFSSCVAGSLALAKALPDSPETLESVQFKGNSCSAGTMSKLKESEEKVQKGIVHGVAMEAAKRRPNFHVGIDDDAVKDAPDMTGRCICCPC